MILDAFASMVDAFRSQIVGIELDGPMSYIYVALNVVLLFFASLTYSQEG